MSAVAISVRGLRKRFRGFLPGRDPVEALKGVDIQVDAGTVVAFVGPNGAGKTTTLHHLLGVLKPDEGEVSLFGDSPWHPKTRMRLGFMPELFQTYPSLTARQIMWFYGRLLGLSPKILAERSELLLAEVGLSHAARRKAGSFSKGMNQRLGLAHALLGRPELLILDEPTTGLDPEGRKLIADMIRRQRNRGTTVFLSSHILSDVQSICDRVVMIRSGRIVLDERIDRLLATSRTYRLEIGGIDLARACAVAGDRIAFQATESGRLGGQVSAEQRQDLLRDLVAAGGDVLHLQANDNLEQIYLDKVASESGS